MRNWISLVLVAAVFFPLPARPIEITQVAGKFSCPELDNQQECAIKFEKLFLDAHPGFVSQDEKFLRIRSKAGRYVLLRNGDPEVFPDSSCPRNVLELQGNGKFLVMREQFFEGNTWQLLDLRNGKLTETFGYSLFSPSGARFVAASEDLDAGYSDTVLDIYQVSASGIKRTFRAIQPKEPGWAARDIRWDGEDTIRFLQVKYSPASPTGFEEIPAYLLYRNGSWELHQGGAR